jgi:hypothetical protein
MTDVQDEPSIPGWRLCVKRYVSLWAVVAVVAATPAAAQPASDEWNVPVAPYLMGAAMSGTTTVRGVDVDVDVSA